MDFRSDFILFFLLDFMGVLFGIAYLWIDDIGYIILYVYGFVMFITFICLIIGLCSKNIKFIKRGSIIKYNIF